MTTPYKQSLNQPSNQQQQKNKQPQDNAGNRSNQRPSGNR